MEAFPRAPAALVPRGEERSVLGLKVVEEGYLVRRPFTGAVEVLCHLVAVSGGWAVPRYPIGVAAIGQERAAVGLEELRRLTVLAPHVRLLDGS